MEIKMDTYVDANGDFTDEFKNGLQPSSITTYKQQETKVKEFYTLRRDVDQQLVTPEWKDNIIPPELLTDKLVSAFFQWDYKCSQNSEQ